ncbi:PREDICTED: caspase-6-like, partial [Amphimedon queenslandica]|uniref:Caspase family p20 domain-containing protein n=1 Tax=Amphimedon queenslandica TaxID=400682 RepID=A0AAN0JG62_AMPQE
MRSIPQGLCLLINIVHFERHEDRPGSNIDAASIKDVFENVLNFQVTMITDPTLQELHQVLIKFFEINHLAYDAFFIVILSHGDFGNVIYTSDSRSIKISEISDYFTSGMCPTLANKPKVFIVQACRGSKHNKTVSTDSKSGGSLDSMIHGLSLSHDGGGLSGVQIDTSTPDRIDFFYAFATIDEHEALRHCVNGSWFINELVTGIRHFAKKYKEVNLEELIKKVNQRLSKKKYEDRMQACEVTSSIRKNIILSVHSSFASRTHSETSSMISSASSSEIVFNQKTLPKRVSSSPRNAMYTELVATSLTSTPSHFYGRSRERWSYTHGSTISLPIATPSATSELVASTSFISLRHQYSESSSYSMSRFSFPSSLASESEINLHSLSGSFSDK